MFSRIFRRNPTAPRAAGISALGVGAGRDLFEVEAMEPRILLSAAPIDVPLAVANVSALPDTQVASDLSVQHSPATSERAAPCARRRVSYGIPIILPLSASGAIFPACANMRAPVTVPPPMSSRRICSMRSRHGRGQPLLIGTRTVDTSERVATLLRGERLPGCDRILNAVRHREEALLVSRAGHRGGITIATSMAGRGTDIRLENGVAILGGLHVVTTEANESARVDRQLFGRAARQGDPGSVMAIYRADDAVLKRFIPGPVLRFWTRSLGCGFLGQLPQWCGLGLLRWSHFRAQSMAARSRRGVMLSETDIQRSLGFTAGRRSGGKG